MKPNSFYKKHGEDGVRDLKEERRVIRECNMRVIVRYKKEIKKEVDDDRKERQSLLPFMREQ